MKEKERDIEKGWVPRDDGGWDEVTKPINPDEVTHIIIRGVTGPTKASGKDAAGGRLSHTDYAILETCLNHKVSPKYENRRDYLHTLHDMLDVALLTKDIKWAEELAEDIREIESIR